MPGHFVNEINSCVDESLIGYVRIHNHLELAGRAVISRSPVPSVALISGSGSGHEPAMVIEIQSELRKDLFCFIEFLDWIRRSRNAECMYV
mgnify:FL=1